MTHTQTILSELSIAASRVRYHCSLQLPKLPIRLRLNPAAEQTDEEFYAYMKVCASSA